MTTTAAAHLATVTSYYGGTCRAYTRQPDGTYNEVETGPRTLHIRGHRGLTLAELIAPGLVTDADGNDLD